MSQVRILWADDEIDLLKPQILFLQNKDYDVEAVTNGPDALELAREGGFDVIFLDESMPGITGLETLTRLREFDTRTPVVMITKNEEEDLMEDAIGSQIADYLIKPVKPQQILLTLKKITQNRRLVSERTSSQYQQEFQKLFMALQDDMDHADWADFYKKLIYWELKLDESRSDDMKEIFDMQKREANTEFAKFIQRNYLQWVQHPGDDAPVLSSELMRSKVYDLLKQDKPTFFILIDNLRFDQWKMIEPLLTEHYRVEEEDHYYSILPTATQYARNSIFAGLMPLDIERRHPNLWKNDDEEGGKNLHEEELLGAHLERVFREPIKFSYDKITTFEKGRALPDQVLNKMHNRLNVIVYNFVDMLSHARTEMEMVKELANDASAYRSLTRSWFEHSPLSEALERLAERDVNVVITTDHGTVNVDTPSKCVGDRHTTTNIRYKNGKNLSYDEKDVFVVSRPKDAMLPAPNVSTSYIFALEDVYLIYPNNYNHYANYFRNTFQHGGISLEEMIVPFIQLTPR